MDRSAVKAIVDAAVGPMAALLGLSHWKIILDYGSTGDEDCAANCLRRIDYGTAFITINPEAMKDERQVLGTLRHELLHIHAAPFDLFYEAALASTDEKADPALKRISRHAHEQFVLGLERMFDSAPMAERGGCWPAQSPDEMTARKGGNDGLA
jgi:hypothetical protein